MDLKVMISRMVLIIIKSALGKSALDPLPFFTRAKGRLDPNPLYHFQTEEKDKFKWHQ